MVLVVILEVFLDKILLFINTDTSIFAYAKAYLAIYLIGMIPSYIFCYITAMLRCYGDSVFQMISMVITSIINAVLDPILIKWIGFHGAADALVQHCIAFLVWGYLFNAVTQCYMGKINGYGQPGKGLVITILNHIVIRIPFSILLSRTFLGLDGIWITLLVSFVAAFICAFLIDKQIQKKLN